MDSISTWCHFPVHFVYPKILNLVPVDSRQFEDGVGWGACAGPRFDAPPGAAKAKTPTPGFPRFSFRFSRLGPFIGQKNDPKNRI